MRLQATVQHPCKLSVFLRRELGLSATLVGRLKWNDALLVDGTPQHTNYQLCPGQIVTAELNEQVSGFEPEALPLRIVYEDEFLIALDKPAGMLVHPSRNRNTGTLANGLLHYYRVTGQPCAIHPVSRLDRDTFGVVLLAKSAHVHAQFCKLHQQGGIEKTYEALVFGHPQPPQGQIDLPIARCDGGSLLRCIRPDGKPARSLYETCAVRAACAHLRLRPVTGRTHQLRLHCMAAGFPILGDPQYATDASRAFSTRCGFETQQLCAVSLAFTHPMTGRPITIRTQYALHLPE